VLTEPNIANEIFVNALKCFGLGVAEATFRPSGDANTAVYRVSTDDRAQYFLKVRCGDFDEIAATVPAYLHSRGCSRIMAPISTTSNQLWVHADGFDWMLYPFFEGKNAFESPLSRARWVALGEVMREVHTAILPPQLARRVPRECYSPRYRAIVKALDRQVELRSFDDPLAAELAAFWTSKRGDIRAVLERAERLAQNMYQQADSFVLCHSDLHAGNVLVGADDQLTIVDWDNPILAPKERDLMFVGAGVGGSWNEPREREWFFTGYGPAEIDSLAIAFYRYERIVVDIAEYGRRIFDVLGTPRERQSDLQKLMSGFVPNNVIDIAHKSYLNLP
jgi:spectinomycin phosphotransferase